MAGHRLWRRGWPLALLGLGVVAGADILGRAAGWGAMGPGAGPQPRVALTFDDGPSERTAELLAVLARHAATATFFVTRPQVQAFPDGVALLESAGHQVEAHGIWHRPALLLPPWREWAQVGWHPRPAGQGLRLFRPPYGGHSPWTRLLARRWGRPIALWDVEGRDWTDTPAPELAAHTLAAIRPGSVVLLHDGPAVTPALLELLLDGLKARGLTPVRLDELPMERITLRQGLRRLRASYGG